MQSKTSFFNPTLFKKNLTRFWPLWGGASALGALVPLAVLTELIESGFRARAGQGLEVTQAYYYGLSYAAPVISLFYAVLCALVVWHYLYNARSVGLFHSLPITRKGLFVTNFLSGMAMMLIPYVVSGALAVLISLAAGLFEPVGVLVTILGVIGESFFYFSTATFLIFITGNPFAFAAFYFIFHFIAAGAEMLVSELMSRFYYGVSQAYEGVVEFLSPTLYLCRKLGVYAAYEQIPTADGWIERGHIESVSLTNGWLIAVYALAGVVLLGCAWLLYQRRRSESAGDVVAVGWMKPVFRYGVALCAALSGGMLLYYLFFAGFEDRSTASALPMALCMAIVGIVGYYIASMLLAKSVKVFRRSAKGVLFTAVASAAACLLIAADPFGVESWVPEAGAVESVSFYLFGSYGSDITINTSDPALIQKLLDLHRTIAAEEDTLDDRNSQDIWGGGCAWIDLYYYMSEGQRPGRSYVLPVSEAALAQLEAVRLAASLASDPDIQEANLFQKIYGDDIVTARLNGGFAGSVFDTETRKINGMDLTLEQAKVLEAAVRRDIQAGNLGRAMLLPDYDEYTQSAYYGDFQLNYNVTWRDDSSRYRSGSQTVGFSISVYCTETLKALEDIGVLDSTHRLLTAAEYYRMERQDDGTWDFYEDSYAGSYAGDRIDEGTIVYPDAEVF